MQLTKTHKIQTDKHKWIYAQWNVSSETKPNPENCKNCSSKCAYDCAQLQYTIQHRTVLIISPLTSRQPHDRIAAVFNRIINLHSTTLTLWPKFSSLMCIRQNLSLSNVDFRFQKSVAWTLKLHEIPCLEETTFGTEIHSGLI